MLIIKDLIIILIKLMLIIKDYLGNPALIGNLNFSTKFKNVKPS